MDPLSGQLKTDISDNKIAYSKECIVARFKKFGDYITIDKHTKHPKIASAIDKVAMWEPNRVKDAQQYQLWANKFQNEIELVRAELVLKTNNEVVPELKGIQFKGD